MSGRLQLLLAFSVARGLLAQCPSASQQLANLTSPPAYDVESRPSLELGVPVNVSIQLYLAAIAEVNQKQQQLALEGYFRQEWTDSRLARQGACAEPMTFNLPVPSVWEPDIYFDNSLSEWYGAGSMSIYEDGRMYRSVRFNHRLRCPMSFERLPFDRQRCFVLLGSYAWDIGNVNVDPFTNGALEVPAGYEGTTEWALAEATYQVTTQWFGDGVNRKGYKYIWIYLDLQRRPNSFLMFVAGTAVLFALVAWAGLFIGRTVAPARVTVAVIPVLIMLNLENAVTSRLPELNYLTWLTSFLFMMKLFTLSCVFEYGLVALLMQVEASRDRQFEALKQMTAAIKKRSADEDPESAGQAWAAPQQGQGRGPVLGKPFDAQANRGSLVSYLAPSGNGGGGPQVPSPDITVVYALFDSDGSGDLGIKEVQKGLRQLGQYLSTDQVHEMFVRLGVQGNRLEQVHFRRLLLDVQGHLPGKAWKIHFSEHPPSMQVDIAFRYLYIVGVSLVTFIWSVHHW